MFYDHFHRFFADPVRKLNRITENLAFQNSSFAAELTVKSDDFDLICLAGSFQGRVGAQGGRIINREDRRQVGICF